MLVFAIIYEIRFLVLLSTLTFNAGFSISTGPVPYVYIAETCCDKGLSFGIFNMWFGTIVVSFISPYLISGLGLKGTFVFFTSIAAAGCFAFYFLIKETKGLSSNEC